MRRSRILTFFFLVIVPVVVAAHAYLAKRLVFDPGFDSVPGLSAAFALLCFILLASPFAERRMRSPLRHLVTWPASVWMGMSFVLFVLVLASDAVLALLDFVVAAAEAGEGRPLVDARQQALAVMALGGFAGLTGMASALRLPRVRRHEVRLSRWPRDLDGFRIVQLSDVHIGPIRGRRFAAAVVRRCNGLAPDLVAVTGDVVDGSPRRLRDEVAPFADLCARRGVYFVTGNHDYFSGVDPWLERWQELGWRALRNARVTIGEGEAAFDLAGVDDRYAHHFGGGHGEDVERALDGRDPSRAVVLLAHNPTVFDRACALGVGLQLSGHTHGGQIWPFGYLVRLLIPYVAGPYRRHGSHLYVSRGTGFWGPPLRVFAPAEITEITIRCIDPGD